MKMKIIVALDGMLASKIFELAKTLQGHVWGFKVNDALVKYGVKMVSELKEWGNVFADPKLFDIPATVENVVTALKNAGSDLITVHALAGAEVLRAAKKAAGDKCKIIGVTVLTSDDQENRQYEVRKRAYISQSAGCDGITCAAPDLEDIKDINLIKVVPGIRPEGKVNNDDQKHISSIIPPLATFVVVGRPITQADDPLEVVRRLNGQVSKESI